MVNERGRKMMAWKWPNAKPVLLSFLIQVLIFFSGLCLSVLVLASSVFCICLKFHETIHGFGSGISPQSGLKSFEAPNLVLSCSFSGTLKIPTPLSKHRVVAIIWEGRCGVIKTVLCALPGIILFS